MSHGIGLQERIRSRFDALSASQRRIAEYMLANLHRVAFMTAASVAQAVGVSESTVVRFATALGYRGYPDLQRALQDDIRAQLTAAERLELAKGARQEPRSIFERVLRSDVENIRKTLQDLSTEAFHAAIEAIDRARQVFCVGLRSATAVSFYLGFYLSFLRTNVHTLHGVGTVFEQLVSLGEDDAVIAISFPRYSRLTYDITSLARARGATTIAITDNVLSPIARQADITLIAHTPMISFADSLVAPLSVANALITALALKNRERTQASLDELERIWNQYDIYLMDR
ncbi:MAG TPA: MurR/RpiR family transcriptional regulator [Bacillota bacterium]